MLSATQYALCETTKFIDCMIELNNKIAQAYQVRVRTLTCFIITIQIRIHACKYTHTHTLYIFIITDAFAMSIAVIATSTDAILLLCWYWLLNKKFLQILTNMTEKSLIKEHHTSLVQYNVL